MGFRLFPFELMHLPLISVALRLHSSGFRAWNLEIRFEAGFA